MDALWWFQFEEMCKKADEVRRREEARQREEAAAEYERHVAEYMAVYEAYERYEAKAAAAERIAEEERAAAAEERAVAEAEGEAAAENAPEAELEVVPEDECAVTTQMKATQESDEIERLIFIQKLQIGSSMAIPAQSGGELGFVGVVVPPICDSRFARVVPSPIGDYDFEFSQIENLGFAVPLKIGDFVLDGGRRPPRKPPDSLLYGVESCFLFGDGRPPRKPPDLLPCGGDRPCFVDVESGQLISPIRPPEKPLDSTEIRRRGLPGVVRVDLEGLAWNVKEEGYAGERRHLEPAEPVFCRSDEPVFCHPAEPAEPFFHLSGPRPTVQGGNWALQQKPQGLLQFLCCVLGHG